MSNKDYSTIEDFISDSSFVNWVNKSQLSDVKFWDHWIQLHPNQQQMVADAKDVIIGIQFKKTTLTNTKINSEWEKFKDEIAIKNQTIKRKIPFYRTKHFTKVAASLIVFLAITSILFTNKSATIIHKAAFGEIADISLPDGTKVILNSNSTLSYKTSNIRTVFLKGEAYFDVKKTPSTEVKFIVNTADLAIEVYGTSFNVNNRKSQTKVFLEEGHVSLKLKNGIEKKMIPGDLISYSYNNNRITEEKELDRAELQTSWKNGALIFDRITLESAMENIENTYGIDVIFIEDNIKERLITGAMPTQNLDICIKTIEKSAKVRIVNKNNKLYIHTE
jgi:ferric-dicitrate binding protein FerR (iron transport regulator)